MRSSNMNMFSNKKFEHSQNYNLRFLRKLVYKDEILINFLNKFYEIQPSRKNWVYHVFLRIFEGNRFVTSHKIHKIRIGTSHCFMCPKKFPNELEMLFHFIFKHKDCVLKIAKGSSKTTIKLFIEKAPFTEQYPSLSNKVRYPKIKSRPFALDIFRARVQHVYFNAKVCNLLYIKLDPFCSDFIPYIQVRAKFEGIKNRQDSNSENVFMHSKNMGVVIDKQLDFEIESENREEVGFNRYVNTFRCLHDESQMDLRQSLIMVMFNQVSDTVRDLYLEFSFSLSLSKLTPFYCVRQTSISLAETILLLTHRNKNDGKLEFKKEQVSLMLMMLQVGLINKLEFSELSEILV